MFFGSPGMAISQSTPCIDRVARLGWRNLDAQAIPQFLLICLTQLPHSGVPFSILGMFLRGVLALLDSESQAALKVKVL